MKPSRYPVSDRLRAKIAPLFRQDRGLARRLARYTEKSQNKLLSQTISYFINNDRPTAIKLDHLDELAAFFRLSIGELLGAAKPGELSGDEQRIVHAFRALPDATRDHFMSIIEQAAIGARIGPIHRPTREPFRSSPTTAAAADYPKAERRSGIERRTLPDRRKQG